MTVGAIAVIGVGLRVGIEALPRLLPEATLRDQAAQDRGRGETLAVAVGERFQALQHDVQAHSVNRHERRQGTAPRVHPGAGHHPEVDVAVGGNPLLQQQAGLDERLRAQQLRELVGIGLGVAGEVGLTLRVVAAIAAGLGAELAFGDQLLHPLGDVEALFAV
jgi:hypothetical protein